jgi:hypothetical protein
VRVVPPVGGLGHDDLDIVPVVDVVVIAIYLGPVYLGFVSIAILVVVAA